METITPEVAVTTVSQLSETGTMGVIFFLLIMLAGAFYFLWKFATNHIEHSNQAFEKVAGSNIEVAQSLTKLKDVIEYKIK